MWLDPPRIHPIPSCARAIRPLDERKTNRPAPRRPDEVPPAYLKQLALYRAVLRRIYPDRPVRAALVWTDVPDLMEISADALDRALTSP